jgi:hypothetical protein
MRKNNKIVDVLIAKRLSRPIDEVREKMFVLSRNQKKKNWLIVFLDNRYIFYGKDVIHQFKDLYNRGFGEKEILENLNRSLEINTRAEIKTIEETLINQKRLDKREKLIKKRSDMHRFI